MDPVVTPAAGPAAPAAGEATTIRNASADWKRFDAAAIPTKESTPQLDAFLAAAPAHARTLLDVGCGAGRLARRIHDHGFSVLGVDVSVAAIRAAREQQVPSAAPGDHWLRFAEADFAAEAPPRLEGGPFDIAVCQLVISIIGGPRERRNLLRNIRGHLRPGGLFFLSASGVSDAINPGYARLYAEDVSSTGERHSYFSRDAAGEILYMTHHFTPEECTALLAEAGFDRIAVETVREASSRRPDEAAFFLYATCRNAPRGTGEP